MWHGITKTPTIHCYQVLNNSTSCSIIMELHFLQQKEGQDHTHSEPF